MTETDAFASLEAALYQARKKHPQFAPNRLQALAVIGSEMQELQEAVLYGEGEEREIAEALDLAVTAMRFILREHEKRL